MSTITDQSTQQTLDTVEVKTEKLSQSPTKDDEGNIVVSDVLEEIKSELLKDDVPVPVIEPKQEHVNEFEYINQGFTSEIFKIEIKNLPRHYGATNLKKLLNNDLKLKPNKMKLVRPGCRYAFACFRSEEDRQEAITKISGYNWKGQKLEAVLSKPTPDPLVKKRNQEKQGGVEPKKQKTLEESTTPLAYLSYEDQCKRKQSEVEHLLKDFGNKYWAACGPIKRSYIEEQRKLHDKLPCKLLPIKPSPQIDGYRNKCEFSVGKDSAGNITIGFRLGSYVDGTVEVGPLDNLKHVSDRMKRLVKLFEEYVRQSDTLTVFDNITHTGHLRTLMVRESNTTEELMLAIGMHPQEMSEEELQSETQKIIKYFFEGAGKEVNITSIYLQRLKKRGPGEQFLQFEHIGGNTHIYDEILGLKFRISPQSFFQVNTKAASVLYETIAELGDLNQQNTVALDICCGIGTIGLSIAKHCKQVLGVELIEEAVNDAQFNAKLNGITNCEFTCANSNDWIRAIMKSDKVAETDRVVAIVDPPRAGLHDRSIAQLRNCENIQTLVYVSCSPKSVFKNFVDLCRPSSRALSGNPFTPKVAAAVDLFPHTPHMELVVLFERDRDTD